jgi:hypothetical protein
MSMHIWFRTPTTRRLRRVNALQEPSGSTEAAAPVEGDPEEIASKIVK